MLNYAVDPESVEPLVPAGTQLDLFQGRCFVSLVGFLFLDTRVRGWAIPFHRNFEEVNLRFYVRREDRRGVVFVKELVPRRAIAWVARAVYGENYEAVPMRHGTSPPRYAWKYRKRWMSMELAPDGPFLPLVPGSEAKFITEHYWGYAGGPGRPTLEYRVEHPSWRVATASRAALDVDAAALYGERFAEILSRPPASAFLAEGSAVTVHEGRPL